MDPRRSDFVLILHGEGALFAQAHIFPVWLGLSGQFTAAMERRRHEIPTVLVSGFPDLLDDAPRTPTGDNAWQTTETMQEAALEALPSWFPGTGRTSWTRHSGGRTRAPVGQPERSRRVMVTVPGRSGGPGIPV